MKRDEVKFLVYGLRKNLGITQKEFGNLIGTNRRYLGKYEDGSRIPNEEKLSLLFSLCDKKRYDHIEIIKYGKKYFYEVRKREKSQMLDLNFSEELAELVGIIMGDGHIQSDGAITIAFNSCIEREYIERRIVHLVKKLIKCNITVKTNKDTNEGELKFYSKPFTKFLNEKCELRSGKKIENQNTIPFWCFDEKYIFSVLRGLFDTDGHFEVIGNSPRVEFKYSKKCHKLIGDSCKALDSINIKYSIKKDKDGITIRIHSKERIFNFFKQVGSSNTKHIFKFLDWRKIQNTNRDYIELPFLWNKSNLRFKGYILEDEEFLENNKIRKSYKWNLISSELLKQLDKKILSKKLNIHPRSIRRWREGKRVPSMEKIPSLLKLSEINGIRLEDYIKNG